MGLGFNRRRRSLILGKLGGPTYSNETVEYFSRLYTQPSGARRAIYDTLIRGLVTAGIYQKLDALYVLRAAREQWAYENIVQPAYRLTPIGGYTFTADEGWTDDGATGYLGTNFIPSLANGHFALDSASLIYYSRTNSQTAGSSMGSRTSGTLNQSFISLRNLSNLSTIRMNSGSAAANPANTNSSGLFVGRRSDASTTALFRNGVKVGSDQLFASTGLPTFELVISAINSGGVIGTPDSRQKAAAGYGATLTDADIITLNTLLDDFFTAIAAQPEPGAGGSDPLVTPNFVVYAYGDSLTTSTFTTRLGTQLARTANNRGIGSQTAQQIAMRQGGVVPTVTISGNQIVAGSNSITHFNGVAIVNMATNPDAPQMLSTPVDNTGRTIKASIAGVIGTIARAASGGPPSTTETYTFTPDADPGTVSCPAGTDVIVQTQTELASTPVIWSGRNNKAINNWSVVAEIQGMVDKLSAVNKHYVVMNILNGNYADEFIGQSAYINLMASNAELEAAFPESYVDVRRYLIDHGLTDAGITPTAQDLIDIANDTVPASLRADNIHLTTAAYQLVADYVAAFMLAKGW